MSMMMALLVIILAVASFTVPASHVKAAAEPNWSVVGTRWDVPADSVSVSEIERFVNLWTTRFLAHDELEAYLNRPGLFDDGFNHLSDEAKAALTVRLIEHWQATIPEFGQDVWTGNATSDQQTFEELAFLVHAVIFDKDGFIGQLKETVNERQPPASAPVDAGIPQFPGMSQEEINATFDALHDTKRIVKAPPTTEAADVAPHTPPAPPVVDESVPLESLPVQVPALLEEILGNVPQLEPLPSAPSTALLEYLLDATTYLACGSVGSGPVKCAPVRTPLGTPVPLDIDDTLGPDVIAHLTPTTNPDFLLGGFAASLSVRPARTPLAAQVFVVYRVVNADLQILAGFDARNDTLGDVQEARVTLKDTAAALTGDVQLRAEITRSGPGNSLTLLTDYARASTLSDPTATLKDPTKTAIKFAPVPSAIKADVRIYRAGTQDVIESAVDASISPTVTASISMDRGTSHRDMVTVIEQLPTHLDLKVTSDSSNTTKLTYNANASIPRITFSDVSVPNTAAPSTKTAITADVRGIPSGIGLTFTPPFNVSYTASSRVTSATFGVSKYDTQGLAQSFGGTVAGIPTAWSVSGVTDPLSVSYSANSAIDSLSTAMYDRSQALTASATATGIPRDMRIDVDDGLAKFSASAPIASVSGTLSKRGLVAAVPSSGNHLSVAFKQASTGTDFVGASFKMNQVSYVEYKRSSQSTFVDLRMGGGGQFIAQGDLNFLTGERAYLYATLSALPSSIQATFGEGTTVTTNSNPDLQAYAEYGTQAALNATPAPPTVHGMAVRDGASGTARAVKTSLWLTGLPSSVTIDSRNNIYSLTNWRPTRNYLVADVELDNFVSPALDAYVQLNGIPNPQTLSFTMKTEDLTGGAKRTKVDLTQTAAMGSLWADATFGVNHGRLEVSNIPDDIHVAYTLQNGQSTLAWDATAPISSMYAGFRVVPQSASFQGYVSLSQLPSDFTMTVGRDPSGNGPTIAYSANASTLDGSAYSDASLFGGDLKARLSFGITDLGATTNVYPSGSGVRFTSSPATGSLYASVWGSYNYYKADSGVWDEGGFLEFPWAYHVGVNPKVNNLAVTLTGFSDFSLTWGITSKLAGAYSQFSFGWSNMSVYLDLYAYFAIRVDWPWPFGSSTITLVNYETHQTVPVNVQFHRYTNHEGYWFGTSGWAICDWSLSATLRPHPHGTSMNSVAVSSATAEGGAWYVTPNPYGLVPNWGVDLVTRYTSPDGGSGPGLNFDYDCF
ncbi:MAG TPA: hypothetical protein VFZ66_18550 [Herpetosiphonaceae bacterium]